MPSGGFERFEVDEPAWNDLPIPDRAREQWTGDSVDRWRAATAMAAVLRRDGVRLGPPYTAWCDGPRVFVSFLPGIGRYCSGQLTLELEPVGQRFGVRAQWSSPDPVWGAVGYEEFHRTVFQLMADRGGCDLDREAVLLVLERRGAGFDHPVAPHAGPVERFCNWLPSPQTVDLLGWDRHPALERAGFAYVAPLYHRPTGCAAWHIVFHGRWSTAAHDEFVSSLRTLLPERVAIRRMGFGCITADVLLAHGQERRGVRRVAKRVNAAVGRACAVQGGPPLLPARPSSVVAPPPAPACDAFARMMQDLGDTENPSVDPLGDGTWLGLSAVDPIGDELLTVPGTWPLGEDAATIRRFVERNELD